MEKQKILFVMHELTSGGAERVILNLVNNLDRDKFSPHLCLFKKTGDMLESLKDDVIIHDLNAPRVSKGIFKISSLILRLKPKFVFTNITHVNLLISVQIKFYKLFLRDTYFISREVNIPSIRAKYKKKSKKMDFIYKRTIHNFDYIIAQSEFMKNDIHLSYNVDKLKIKVINNPIDIEAINYSIKKSLVNKLLHENKINILAVGNLRAQKGFDILLQAVPFFHDNIHLSILGDGVEKEKLKNIIEKLNINDKVTLLGSHKNPYQYMKQSDMVVSSSLYEGFPNVILEANACGKFVVAFECPGINSEIILNEVNGFLVENKNIEALAKAINKYALYKHDEKEIISTTNRFNVKKITKDYEKILLSKH